MKKLDVKGIANLGKIGLRAMNRNLPSILTGAAIAGLAATVWATFKAAPKINEAIDDAKQDKVIDNGGDPVTTDVAEVDLTAWETFKAVAPYVWKPALCGAFTVGCVVGAQVLNMQRLTMLAGAYKLSEKKLKEYEEKAKELFGEKKAADLRSEVVKGMCDAPYDENMVVKTGKGEELFYDTFSGRYFQSSEKAIREAEGRLNKSIAKSGGFVELNLFYDMLGIEDIKVGNDFGWGNTQRAKSGTNPSCVDIKIAYETREVNGKQVAIGLLDYDVGLDYNALSDYFQDRFR